MIDEFKVGSLYVSNVKLSVRNHLEYPNHPIRLFISDLTLPIQSIVLFLEKKIYYSNIPFAVPIEIHKFLWKDKVISFDYAKLRFSFDEFPTTRII